MTWKLVTETTNFSTQNPPLAKNKSALNTNWKIISDTLESNPAVQKRKLEGINPADWKVLPLESSPTPTKKSKLQLLTYQSNAAYDQKINRDAEKNFLENQKRKIQSLDNLNPADWKVLPTETNESIFQKPWKVLENNNPWQQLAPEKIDTEIISSWQTLESTEKSSWKTLENESDIFPANGWAKIENDPPKTLWQTLDNDLIPQTTPEQPEKHQWRIIENHTPMSYSEHRELRHEAARIGFTSADESRSKLYEYNLSLQQKYFSFQKNLHQLFKLQKLILIKLVYGYPKTYQKVHLNYGKTRI